MSGNFFGTETSSFFPSAQTAAFSASPSLSPGQQSQSLLFMCHFTIDKVHVLLAEPLASPGGSIWYKHAQPDCGHCALREAPVLSRAEPSPEPVGPPTPPSPTLLLWSKPCASQDVLLCVVHPSYHVLDQSRNRWLLQSPRWAPGSQERGPSPGAEVERPGSKPSSVFGDRCLMELCAHRSFCLDVPSLGSLAHGFFLHTNQLSARSPLPASSTVKPLVTLPPRDQQAHATRGWVVNIFSLAGLLQSLSQPLSPTVVTQKPPQAIGAQASTAVFQ